MCVVFVCLHVYGHKSVKGHIYVCAKTTEGNIRCHPNEYCPPLFEVGSPFTGLVLIRIDWLARELQ